MKAIALFATFVAAVCCSFGQVTNPLERFSPHFSTNTEIIWQAPTAPLPQSLWIYQRLPPQPFLASVISNAVILASMQDQGFPAPSTNDFYVSSTPNPCGMSFSIFSILPSSATISFSSTNQSLSTNEVPDDNTVTRKAFEYAARLGLNSEDFVPGDVYSLSNAAGCDATLTNGICGRGIVLARKLDGISFFTYGKAGNNTEGFSVEFGSGGQIRSFSLVWPNLKPDQKLPIASPAEIVQRVREHRILVLPEEDETNYFARVKTLSAARAFTITKITPRYSEGVLGDIPTNDTPPQTITPIADVEAVAALENTNIPIRFLTSILTADPVNAIRR